MREAMAKYIAEGGDVQRIPYRGDTHCPEGDCLSFLHDLAKKDVTETGDALASINQYVRQRYTGRS